MLLRTSSHSEARRGVILMVVLALLTLFAIVGLSFVLYAYSEADSSRLHREDKNLRQALESPDRMWGYALSKLLYDDYDDATGVYSALRGHSLARSMYGFDYTLAYDRSTNNPPVYVPNQTPFNGTGRLQSGTITTPFGIPEWQAVNYTYFPADGQGAHDPERLGWGPPAFAPPNPRPITGGFNVPYTYPDLNNMFLGAVNAAGQVLMPSFHRPWLFGAIDPTSQPTGTNPNSNWTNPQGKYMTLRPRPIDNGIDPSTGNPLFPYPEDAGGDVKNLYWLPGGNDSIWTDLGYPVQIAPDGRKYKPLFAFFITDLDNRINLNASGNIRGAADANGLPTHASNIGWVKTEVNLSKVLIPGVPTANMNAPANVSGEWTQLFTGVPVPGPGSFNQVTDRGKYGWNVAPDDPLTYGTGGNYASPGTTPHAYGQVDYDGCQANFTPTLPILLPGQVPATWGPYNCFPGFLTGYDNGNQPERTNHPLIYDYFRPFSVPAGSALASPTPVAPDNRPASDDRAFPASEMKELLMGGLFADPAAAGPYGNAPVMAANAMKSQLGALLPFNFNDPLDIAGSLRRRSLVTTISMDIDQPGLMPWMWQNADGTNASGVNVASLVQANARPGDDPDAISSRAPWGNPSLFPDPSNRGNPIPFNSEFAVQSPPTGPQTYPQSTWRAVTNGANPPFNTNVLGLGSPLPGSALAAIKPFLGRLDLSRPLQPFPNQINPAITRFDDNTTLISAVGGQAGDTRTIYQVYQQAMQDRQLMARDIYRLLIKLCGVQAVTANPPTPQDLMPRRWFAQLAVNMVDFIDSDDISTPFNFYPDSLLDQPLPAGSTVADSNLPPTETPPATPPVLIQGNPTATPPVPSVNEMLRYWVFGVEMPRVVLNEVFAEYNWPAAGGTNPVPVNVWAELFCPMPAATSLPATVDPTDGLPVQLAIPATATTTAATIAPYRVMLANTDTATPGGPLIPRPTGATAPSTLSPYDNDNILGTPDQIRQFYGTDDNQSAGAVSQAATVAFTGGMVGTATAGSATLTMAAGTPSIAPQGFLIVGPGNNATGAGFADRRATIPNNLPTGTPCIATGAMSYNVNITAGATGQTWNLGSATGPLITDNTTGVTVLLRRLSNPRMPAQPNPAAADFNPYVTVDYLQGIKLNNYAGNTPANYYWSSGKLQPYAADPNMVVPQGNMTAPNPLPATGATAHTLGQPNVWGQAAAVQPQVLPGPPPAPNPAYPAFDWLVHLDRALVSPIELLNVCFFHAHELTHRFIQPVLPAGTPLPATVPLPSQWKYKHTGLGPWFDGTVARTGPWFDQTTRLYRLFEFVETYDRAYGMSSDGAFGLDPTVQRAYGVSSIGRRPGRINPNTIWDPETMQALFDSQPSNYFSANDVVTMYNNLITSRTPGYAAAIAAGGNPLTAISQADRPFFGMGAGNMPYADPNYGYGQNGMGIGDTFLRPNTLAYNNLNPGNPFPDTTQQGHPELPRLFENPNALGAAPSYIPTQAPPAVASLGHPYLRFEPLNKVYNNLTSRSNVFGVWCTVGYFEVVDDTARPVKLGAEIGKAAGTNVRHRFFSVIDRTEMVIARNLISAANGPGGAVVNPNNALLGPGQAWVEVDLLSGPAQFATYNNGVVSESIPNPSGQPPLYWTMSAGTVLVVDRGTRNEEWVQITNMWPPNSNPPPPGTPPPGMPPASPTNNSPFWIQANFIRPHNPGFSITQPGNPGPQPPLDMRNYVNAPVVPVSVTIEPNGR